MTANLLLFLVCPFAETKTKTKFSARWWSGKKKYFCFLFIGVPAVIQRYAESIDFYERIFIHVIPAQVIVLLGNVKNLYIAFILHVYVTFPFYYSLICNDARC